MKRYSQRSGHTAMAELNVTPLLDLAFVLLIIFIITTPLLESKIDLQLPTGSPHASAEPDPKSVRTVSVTRTGQIYLGDQPVTQAELVQELTQFHDQVPDAAVVIRADRSLHVQNLVDVYDALQQARIDRMSLDKTNP